MTSSSADCFKCAGLTQSVIQIYFLERGAKWIKYTTSGRVTVGTDPAEAQRTLPWAHELSNLLTVAAWASDQSELTESSVARFRRGTGSSRDFQRGTKCNNMDRDG